MFFTASCGTYVGLHVRHQLHMSSLPGWPGFVGRVLVLFDRLACSTLLGLCAVYVVNVASQQVHCMLLGAA